MNFAIFWQDSSGDTAERKRAERGMGREGEGFQEDIKEVNIKINQSGSAKSRNSLRSEEEGTGVIFHRAEDYGIIATVNGHVSQHGRN